MSNYNHTSEGWKFRTGDNDNYFEVLGPYKSHKTICLLPKKCFVPENEAEANARLIAAAPDLLSVLKEAVDYSHVYNTPPVLVELFTAAINAATGVSIEQSIS